MASWLRQSTAVDVSVGPFLDETTGKDAETGLTITQPDIRLKKNGGAWAQKNAAQTLSHEENGWYEVALDTTDTNTLGILLIAIHEAGALPVWREFMVIPAEAYDALVSGSGVGMRSDVRGWLGTTPATPTVAGVPEVDLTHIAGDAQSGTDLKDFADSGYDPATNKVQGVVLTDTVTTYTGNTPQTGDAFARLGAPAGASVSADIAAIEAQTDDIGAAGAGLTALGDARLANLDATVSSRATPAQVNTEVDAALADIHLDHLLATDYDPAAKPGTATALLNELVESDAGVSRFTANALEQAPAGGGGGVADWTAGEREQIRQALGVDGTKAATSGGHVDAIKAKTDNLPSDPADQSLIIAATTQILTDVADVESKVDDLETRLTAQRAANLDNLDAAVSTRATPAQVQAELVTYDAPTFAELDARTDAIEADTQDIQARLPAALVSGRMSSDAVAISGSTAAADSVESSIGNLDAAVSSRATPVQVNAEVVDALTVDTYAEPAAVPAATSSLKDKILWLFTLARNKVTQTATTQTVRNDADNATIATSTVSDDATTAVRGKYT